jgi:integrase
MNFGRTAYERLRARAMVLLMRYYGLRISDVATLKRDHVCRNQETNEDENFLHAVKNDEPLWLPVYPAVREALELVPIPRGCGVDCGFYFWSGEGAREYQVVKIERTLKTVFRANGVENAHAHRFRHTLATELLAKAGPSKMSRASLVTIPPYSTNTITSSVWAIVLAYARVSTLCTARLRHAPVLSL